MVLSLLPLLVLPQQIITNWISDIVWLHKFQESSVPLTATLLRFRHWEAHECDMLHAVGRAYKEVILSWASFAIDTTTFSQDYLFLQRQDRLG